MADGGKLDSRPRTEREEEQEVAKENPNADMQDMLAELLSRFNRIEKRMDSFEETCGVEQTHETEKTCGVEKTHDMDASADRVGFETGCALSTNTADRVSEDEGDENPGEEDSDSVFRISVPKNPLEKPMDILDTLESELEIKEEDGPPVSDKLARIVANRFTVRMSEHKLQERLNKHLIPSNCPEIKAPLLNEEIGEKGLIDRIAKKNDGRLLNIQRLLSKATAALINASEKMHSNMLQIASAPGSNLEKEAMINSANEGLSANADVIALLGIAQMDLSQRRRFQLQPSMPKDVAAIASAKIEPGTDKLFGQDADRLIRSARETYKASNRTASAHRFQPYNQRGGRHFLGRSQGPLATRGFPATNRSRGPVRGRGAPRASYRK